MSDARLEPQPIPNPLPTGARRRIRSALACLTKEEQTAYELRFLDGMELTRVATTMHVSVGTVKRRLASARQALERAAQTDPYLLQYTRPFSVSR